jgi:hypothetical protein
MKVIDRMSKETRMANNMAFMFADLSETMLLIAQEQFKKDGFEMKHEYKMNFKKFIHSAKTMRQTINGIADGNQQMWADDADHLLELVCVFADRCGDNDKLAEQFINYIRAFPSKEGLDLSKFGV